MDKKDTILDTVQETKMLYNEEYFKYIFKKTEKIACAVFYILCSNKDKTEQSRSEERLEDAANKVLEIALSSLDSTTSTVQRYLSDLKVSLIALESRLRVAYTTQSISEETLHVFLHEIDSLQRSIRPYVQSSRQPELSHSSTRQRVQSAHRSLSSAPTQSTNSQQKMPHRKDRIMTFLKERPNASIKDISTEVSDCSEKTIQRELMSLIKQGKVSREGERRWSTYRLV